MTSSPGRCGLIVNNPRGRFVVEQEAYVAASETRSTWMRVVRSGFRPLES